jgi:hypothetical protein
VLLRQNFDDPVAVSAGAELRPYWVVTNLIRNHLNKITSKLVDVLLKIFFLIV